MNETPPPVPVTLHVKTSALAICGLVFGIVGLVLSIFCIGIPLAITGVICAHMALSRIKHSGGLLTGSGLAIGGLVTGYVGIAMIMVLLPIAIPNFIKARNTAQTNMCINNLRQIDSAKSEWALEHGKKAEDVPTAADLTPYLKNGHMPVCPAGGCLYHRSGQHAADVFSAGACVAAVRGRLIENGDVIYRSVERYQF